MVAQLFPGFQFVWLSEETKRNLPLELDFYHEARNCERASEMFRNFDFIKVGLILREWQTIEISIWFNVSSDSRLINDG